MRGCYEKLREICAANPAARGGGDGGWLTALRQSGWYKMLRYKSLSILPCTPSFQLPQRR